MTREPQTSPPPQNAAYAINHPAAINQPASAQYVVPVTASYPMQPVSVGTPQLQRSHSASSHVSSKGAEFSAQFKQKEAMRLQKMSGRPSSGSKLAKSQMAMMQQSMMMQSNMMMMHMMSQQQQQRYAGDQSNMMTWGHQQHVPSMGTERAALPGATPPVPPLAPGMAGAPPLPPTQPWNVPTQQYMKTGSAPASMTRPASADGGACVGLVQPSSLGSAPTSAKKATQRSPRSPETTDVAPAASSGDADRKAALQVLQAVEAKFEEMCKYQGKLLSKINTMQERIAEKDALIDTLRLQGAATPRQDARSCAASSLDSPLAAEIEERDALTNELSRLQLQMADAQTTMEDAMETSKAIAGQFDAAPAGLPHAAGIAVEQGQGDSERALHGSSTAAELSFAGAWKQRAVARGASVSVGDTDTQPEAATPQAAPASSDHTAGAAGGSPRGAGVESADQGQCLSQEAEPCTAQPDVGSPEDVGSLEDVGEGGRAVKNVMSWQQVEAPAIATSGHMGGVKTQVVARDEDSGEQSGSTPPDSDSTYQSAASPVAGGRRHVFRGRAGSGDDTVTASWLRLPPMPSAARRKRNQLEKMFQR